MSNKQSQNKLAAPRLIISVKEARKLLGTSAVDMTNEELCQLIQDYELLARHAVREHLVRKETMVL